MIKKILFAFFLILFSFINTTDIFAIGITGTCFITSPLPNNGCDPGLFCQPTTANPSIGSCEENTIQSLFGQIKAPSPLARLLNQDSTGGGAISKFLSNFVTLIYIVAAIVLIFMFLWGAFEWMTSGGDKEKIASAQRRIINAFIGILLFAVAFAVISLVGQFTGFTFFSDKSNTTTGGPKPIYCPPGQVCVVP